MKEEILNFIWLYNTIILYVLQNSNHISISTPIINIKFNCKDGLYHDRTTVKVENLQYAFNAIVLKLKNIRL